MRRENRSIGCTRQGTVPGRIWRIYSAFVWPGYCACSPAVAHRRPDQTQGESMRKWIVLAAMASVAAGMAPAGLEAQKPAKPVVSKEHKEQESQKVKASAEAGKQKLEVAKNKEVLAKQQKRDESIASAKRTPKPNKGGKIEPVSARRDRNDRDDDDVYRGSLRGNGTGPKFCRTGEGHPVHGRQWCVQKGFGLGNASWDRGTWDDVIFRAPQRTNLQFGRGPLLDVLGNVVLNRLDARRRTFGIESPLTGRWLDGDDRSVLLVTAGGVPLDELVDSNGDRRAELVLLNFRR